MVRGTASGEATVLVGREAGADLFLPDPSVSRRHLLLSPGPDGWRWRDLGSKNGTRRLDGPHDAPLGGIAWFALGTILVRAETAAGAPSLASPEDVLSDVLPLAQAAGARAEGEGGGPVVSCGDVGAPVPYSLRQAGMTLTLHSAAEPERLGEVERGLVLAIARQSLLVARAARTSSAIQSRKRLRP